MRPDIRGYQDFRLYLRAMIQWLGEQDRKYSLRWLAQRAGFSTPSMFSMILSGKRELSKDKISSLCMALKLLSDEESQFRLLVDLATCENKKDEDRIKNSLRQYHGGLFQDPNEEGYEVFSKWYMPAIRELVAVQGFRGDPFWIAGKIGITPIEAKSVRLNTR